MSFSRPMKEIDILAFLFFFFSNKHKEMSNPVMQRYLLAHSKPTGVF